MEVRKRKDWNQNLTLVPCVSQSDIDHWAISVAQIQRAKQTKGYSNFIEGYIQDVQGM